VDGARIGHDCTEPTPPMRRRRTAPSAARG